MKNLYQIVRTLFLFLVAMNCLGVYGQNPWRLHSSMNVPRNVFALVPCNGKLYAIGGENQTILKSVEVYDPATQRWQMKSDIPEVLSWCQGFSIDGIIYIVCNQTTNFNWTKAVYAYNTETDSWCRKADMPVSDFYMKAAMVDGYIYVMADSVLVKYDPINDKWETVCSLDPSRDKDVACIGLKGKMYLVGNTVRQFDVKTNEWKTLKSLPFPRTGVGLVEVNGRIYSVSGWINDYPNWYSRHLESYHPESGEWTVKHILPQATNHLPAYASMNGKIYYAGGLVQPNRYTATLRTVYEYDPALDTVNTVSDYDGNSYNTTTIGTQQWMKENLRSEHYADGGKIEGVFSYENSDENGITYGKLYTLKAATKGILRERIQGVCPAGWHLPDSSEWIELIENLGGRRLAGEKMKATTNGWNENSKSNNQSGFSALPSGMIVSNESSFLGTAAFYRSSSPASNGDGWVYDLYYNSSGIEKDYCDKNDAVSVRCVKDKVYAKRTIYNENGVSVYPNPFSSTVTFTFQAHEADRLSLFVYRLNGEPIFHEDNMKLDQKNRLTVNLESLPEKGIYLYRAIFARDIKTGLIIRQ